MGKVIKKIFIALLVVAFLLGIAAAGYAIGKNGLPTFGQGKPGICEHEYGADGKCTKCGADKPSDDKPDKEKADMLLIGNEEQGISLTSALIDEADYAANGITKTADTAYTLTAAVYNDQHTTSGVSQLVNVDVQWENPGNVNYTEVTPFLTVTRTADNSFIVTCLKAFSEPIILTITSADERAVAKKRCEYIKRISDLNMHTSPLNNWCVSVDKPTILCSTEAEFYPDGTLQGKVNINQVTFFIEKSFVDIMTESNYYKNFAGKCKDVNVELDIGYEVSKDVNASRENFQLQFDLRDFLLTNIDENTVRTIEEAVGLDYLRYAVIETAAKITSCIRYEINYTYEYNEVIYSTGTFISGPPNRFDTSSLGSLPASSIEITGGEGEGFIF